MKSSYFRKIGVGVLAASFLGMASMQPVSAAMIGTADAIAIGEHLPTVAEIQGLMERDDVRDRLVELGVDPVEASERVAALTEDEVARINGRIAELPAGGNVLAVIGIVFLVLLILEVVGVTNIFTKV